MKTHSNEEIIEKCNSIWCVAHKEHEHYADHNIKVIVNTPDLVMVKVDSMYESPLLNFGILMQLAEFFETKNINDDERFSEGGCETCDYGSSYGFTLVIRPE